MTLNHKVGGSSPPWPTFKTPAPAGVLFFCVPTGTLLDRWDSTRIQRIHRNRSQSWCVVRIGYAKGVVSPVPAYEVAFRFVRLAEKDARRISQLDLHKLVYAAHGWNLGIRREPLINEDVEAWDYGPVIVSLRNQLRVFGAEHISTRKWIEAGLPAIEADHPVIDQTWAAYKELSPGDLVDLTHMPGTPWSETYIPGVRHNVIPRPMIEGHFVRKLEDRDAVRGI